MLCRYCPSGGGLTDFAELADESRLGELPTDEELRLLLFDPSAPHAAPAGGGGSGCGAGAGAARAALLMQLPQPAALRQHASSYSSSAPAAAAAFEAPAAALAAAAAARPASVLRIRTGAGAPGGAGARAAADTGSPKRRADRMELDPLARDSPRGGKRHSGGAAGAVAATSGSAWSEGTEDRGGESPGSGELDSSCPHHAWFTGEGAGPGATGSVGWGRRGL